MYTVKQVLQWILGMPFVQKIQDLPLCICKLVQMTAHKLILHTEISYNLHSSSIFHTDLASLITIKFTCRFYGNSLGDQGVKAICEPLKAMRNLQELKWVDVDTTSQLTCIGGGVSSFTSYCAPPLLKCFPLYDTYKTIIYPGRLAKTWNLVSRIKLRKNLSTT